MNGWLTSDEKSGNVKATGEQSFYSGGEEVYRISENLPYDGQCCHEMKMERSIIYYGEWEKFQLNAKFIHNNKPMRTMMHTHTHKCCDIGLVLPWGDMPWNKMLLN